METDDVARCKMFVAVFCFFSVSIAVSAAVLGFLADDRNRSAELF